MALQVHRLGDCNNAGGCITVIPQSSVFVNGILVCIEGSLGTDHTPCGQDGGEQHCAGAWITIATGPSVFAEGMAVIKMGDPDTCGHIRAGGSIDVFID